MVLLLRLARKIYNFGVSKMIVMRRYVILANMLIISILQGYSQEPVVPQKQVEIYRSLYNHNPGEGKVILIQDEKLGSILYAQIQLNKQQKDIPRYWIRIFSNSGHGSREKAYAVKASFLKKFEGINNNVIYDDPNYKVYVGGYYSKSEALQLLYQLKQDFPSAFIIYDRIEFQETERSGK
jgi:hypothetical protein